MRVVWKILKVLAVILLLLVGAAAYLWYFQRPHHSAPREAAKTFAPTGDKAIDSIRKGGEYLRIHQETNGHFSKGILDPKPGFTSMAVDALARSPEKFRESSHPFIANAVKAILENQRADGAFATSGLGVDSYTTAISMMALAGLKNPAYQNAIEQGKKYLYTTQNAQDEGSPFFGGSGYRPGGRPSGDNTAQWIEALKAAGVKEDDPAFKNAEKFLSRLQNNPETNDKPAEGMEIGNDGGFFYRNDESPAGFDAGKTGKKIPRSYGLMTYAGLHSFMYLAVKKDDPRVQSAWKWVQDNYMLTENRNIGKQGLYRYHLTMAKALSAYGEKMVKTTDGKDHDWAQEMIDHIVSLQQPDGSWMNTESARWMENDAVLCTSYAIRTLTICYEFKNRK